MTRYGSRYLWISATFVLMLIAYGCGGGGGSDDGGGNTTAQPFTIEFSALNYRNFEDPADNYVGGYVGLAENGGIVQATDIVDHWMTNSAGWDVIGNNDGFGVDRYYVYECRGGGACSQSGVSEQSTLWGTFNPLPDDIYTAYIEMTDGQILSCQFNYSELHLPFIPAADMQSQWVSGDLVLSWTNPTTEPNWNQVTMLRIFIFTTTGPSVISINLDPGDETVTVPASLVADAEALGLGAMLEWRIEARVYDTQDRNYARSVSEILPLAIP